MINYIVLLKIHDSWNWRTGWACSEKAYNVKTEEDLGGALRFSNFEWLIGEESENKIGKEKPEKEEKNQKNAQKLREKRKKFKREEGCQQSQIYWEYK